VEDKMKKYCTILLAVALCCVLFVSPAFSAIVGLKAHDTGLSTITVAPSSTFQVDLYISGLTALDLGTNGLVGFTMAIESNSLIAFQSFTPSALWSPVDITPSLGPNVTSNLFKINGYASGDSISSDNTIGTFTLQCLGLGQTVLNPKGQFAGLFNWALADASFLDSSITYQSVTVNQTPIPAAVWLLGSGLVGLVALRRRMKK
jgi:hypothetical protein